MSPGEQDAPARQEVQHRRQRETHGLATLWTDLYKASRADWFAGEVQSERGKTEHQVCVHFLDGGRQLSDMQDL